MSKHTPGPWIVAEHNWSDTTIYADDPEFSIALLSIEGRATEETELILAATQRANAKLIAAAPELLEALIALTTNKHLDLGDLVYHIRDRELEGWDGPSVKAWSDAVTKAQNAIAKATK